jgi:hypothetical protein
VVPGTVLPKNELPVTVLPVKVFPDTEKLAVDPDAIFELKYLSVYAPPLLSNLLVTDNF